MPLSVHVIFKSTEIDLLNLQNNISQSKQFPYRTLTLSIAKLMKELNTPFWQFHFQVR